MWRERSKIAGGLVVVCAVMASSNVVFAGAHTWDVNEVFSNADGTIQFVELREANGTPGEINLNGRTVSSDATGKSFTIVGNVESPSSNRLFLIATQSFADLPGAPTPDRILPLALMPFFFSVSGDTVRYNPYDAFTFGPVPTDGINSMNRIGGVAANSPTNYAGATGSVDASGPVPGDFDGDGDVDLDDHQHMADCLEGPDATPVPTLPDVTDQDCLDAFDMDADGDVDLTDFHSFQQNFTV